MIDLAHSLGLRMALWHTPYLDRSDPATKTLRDYASAHSFYPPRNGLLFNNWGRPIDFTNPDAKAWWQSLIHQYTDAGIEGFKLDYAEDVVVGLAVPVFALANTMSSSEYSAAKENANAAYKSAKAQCDALSGNAKDVCIAQAKGNLKKSKADAEAQYKNTDKARRDLSFSTTPFPEWLEKTVRWFREEYRGGPPDNYLRRGLETEFAGRYRSAVAPLRTKP